MKMKDSTSHFVANCATLVAKSCLKKDEKMRFKIDCNNYVVFELRVKFRLFVYLVIFCVSKKGLTK